MWRRHSGTSQSLYSTPRSPASSSVDRRGSGAVERLRISSSGVPITSASEAEVALHRAVHDRDVGVAIDDDDERVGDVDHLAQVVAVVARLAEEVEVAQRHRELIGERDDHRLVGRRQIARPADTRR